MFLPIFLAEALKLNQGELEVSVHRYVHVYPALLCSDRLQLPHSIFFIIICVCVIWVTVLLSFKPLPTDHKHSVKGFSVGITLLAAAIEKHLYSVMLPPPCLNVPVTFGNWFVSTYSAGNSTI